MIVIDDIEYKEEDLSEQQKNWVYALNEILTSRRKILIELEKIDVLTQYYKDKIKNDVVKKESKEDK
jgi:hypothetical protein